MSKNIGRPSRSIPAGAFLLEARMTQSEFLKHLKSYRGVLPRHTLLTLRGQAISGDVDGAMRGLARMLKDKPECVPPTA